MNVVCCFDSQGKAVPLPADSILYSPAAYGILIERNQVLLLEHPATGLLYPPGGTLSPRQTPDQTILIHVRQVAGMNPAVGPLLFVEDQYRVDEQGQGWHLSVLYYALERPAVPTIVAIEMVRDSSAKLISLEALRREHMLFGYEAINAGRIRLEL